jgi:hypothetical protein
MKRDFTHENFEDFLKRSADNLRMKAPERVWENLSNKLNKERRRFGTGLSAFLLLTGLVGYLTISTTAKQALLTSRPAATIQTTANNRQERTVTQNRKGSTGQSLLRSRINSQAQQVVPGLRNAVEAQTTSPEQTQTAGNGELLAQNSFMPTPVDDYPETAKPEPAEKAQASKPAFLMAYNATPWSIESVTNSYVRKKSRFRTEFHFTPTISYRKLSENKSYLRNASLLNSSLNYAALYGSVNSMVTHKPDIGFELGITQKYSLTNKLRIRGGLQFNVNRYDIKAFKSPFAVATIALNRRGSARVDSVYTLSSYSNVDASSNKSNWLQNLSFQVSAPVGFELALKGNEKMQFGIATTVQPTYILGDRAYLITTDYKNYTQVPWLLRRWNVNTAFETFVSYQGKKTKWQVGPQVRYQLLSSFISNYPVKENLFDFGLKIGVSVNK